MIEVIEEIWKPIKDYEEFYEISNLGNVKAKERIRIDKNGVKRKYKEKILLPVNQDILINMEEII